MKRYWPFKALKIATIIILVAAVVGLVIEHLWNWLMPAIFGLPTITYLQALGLLLLSKILLGGIHRHSGGWHGRRRHLQERWEQMSPEERERFRAGMRGRRGCGPFGRPDPPPPAA
jgi:hypothetical protein